MPNYGYIQLTRLCNQKCLFCSNPEIDATLGFDEISDLLKLYSGYEYEGVILTGGEPTLHPELCRVIAAAREMGLRVKLITNGQNTSDPDFFKEIVSAGLNSIVVSVHSHIPETQNFLADNPDSFGNIKASLSLTSRHRIDTNIAITINAYNAPHLHETAEWFADAYPHISHYVFNNLDPLMNRATVNAHTIPKLSGFELSLFYAMVFLRQRNISFRVERVPLCFMADFAAYSTETRKIIKGEERSIFFLDDKGLVRQQQFIWSKTECCDFCFLSPICAGLYAMGEPYDKTELSALFLDPENVKKEVLSSKL